MSKHHLSENVLLNSTFPGLLSLTSERTSTLFMRGPIEELYEVEQSPFARGKFAVVRRVVDRTTGVAYAAKYVRQRRRASDQRPDILHEAAVLDITFGHERVVKLRHVYETSVEIIFVLEMAVGGELQRVIDEDERLEESEAVRMMRQTLEGLSCLHAHNIAHLDLKPQNVLLTGPFPRCDVKLCDFGISRHVAGSVEVREILGTPDYVAPEVLNYEPVSLATDIWSVGVLAYVLLTGYSPFAGESKQETFLNISQGKVDFPDDLFESVSENAKNFILMTLKVQASERPTVKQCLDHPWLMETLNMTPLTPSRLGTKRVEEFDKENSGDKQCEPPAAKRRERESRGPVEIILETNLEAETAIS